MNESFSQSLDRGQRRGKPLIAHGGVPTNNEHTSTNHTHNYTNSDRMNELFPQSLDRGQRRGKPLIAHECT